MTIYLWNLTAYTLQLGAVIAVALFAVWALRVRMPRHTLRFWQAVVAIALLIPLAQPRAATPGGEPVSWPVSVWP